MGQRSVLWPKLPATKDSLPESSEPSLEQEDPETRIAVTHYLLLADCLLSDAKSLSAELDEVA